jgi:hypothetical protein
MFSYPAKLNIITRVPYKSLCPPWKVLLTWRSNLKNQPFTTRTPPSYKVVCSRINGEFKHIPTINLTLILANLNQIFLGKFFLPALPQSRPLFTSSCSLADKSMKNFTTQKWLWIYQDILNQPWGDHGYNEGLKQMRYFRVSEHGKYQHVPV